MSVFRDLKLFRTTQRNVICILQTTELLEIQQFELQKRYVRIIILTYLAIIQNPAVMVHCSHLFNQSFSLIADTCKNM